MPKYYMSAKRHNDPNLGVAGYCPHPTLFELVGDGLEVFDGLLHKADNLPSACSMCGKPYPKYRLTISDIEDLRNPA